MMKESRKADKKREAENNDSAVCKKRPKTTTTTSTTSPTSESTSKREAVIVQHSVLSCYHEKVLTLRRYLITFLSTDASKYAKAISRLEQEMILDIPSTIENNEILAKDLKLLLDTTLVGSTSSTLTSRYTRQKEIAQFSQQLQCSTNVPSSIASDRDPDARLQLEVVNFVIWLIFRSGKYQHLLAQGYARAAAPGGYDGLPLTMAAGLPGITCLYPNDHVATLTNSTWCALLTWLGKGGDLAMVELLLSCAVYLPIIAAEDKHIGNFYQISGRSIQSISKHVLICLKVFRCPISP